ncbi:MAG TPA: DMT family transporter [Thermoanaerobacterales bacterium]|nr:DMT family transporter [Thermoanaerobacterales bacterium]
MRKSLIADGALLLVAISWGLNFVVEKNVLQTITPYMYLGLRFVLSALIMAVIFHKRLKQISKEDIKAGLVVGLFMLLGFITQTVGLVYTTPSKSGFITGSNVVMVPFLAYVITKKFPGMFQIVGAIVTFGGLALISVNDNLTIGQGDILTFICAACFALQITFTEYYVKKADPLNMAFIQIALAGMITMGITVTQEPVSLGFDFKIWSAILFGAIFCTAGAFVIQNIAQKHTSSTHAAVILCAESVFAGIFSFVLWGEPLNLRTLTGFALVLAGILITELVPPKTAKNVKESVDTAI